MIDSLAKICLLVGVLLAGCDTADERRERVMLLTAASTTDAVEEIADCFQRRTGIEVIVSTGPSNALARQVMAGAPADVLLSANARWAGEIEKAGLAVEVRPLLSNRLVLIAPRGNPAGVESIHDLRLPRVRKIALAGQHVPAGVYAEQALRSLAMFEELESSGKIARGHDVRSALSYVERGEADAGLVYATDAKISDGVEVVAPLDESLHQPIVYPAVLLKTESENAAAREFFAFLISSAAEEVFRLHGFVPLSGAAE